MVNWVANSAFKAYEFCLTTAKILINTELTQFVFYQMRTFNIRAVLSEALLKPTFMHKCQKELKEKTCKILKAQCFELCSQKTFFNHFTNEQYGVIDLLVTSQSELFEKLTQKISHPSEEMIDFFSKSICFDSCKSASLPIHKLAENLDALKVVTGKIQLELVVCQVVERTTRVMIERFFKDRISKDRLNLFCGAISAGLGFATFCFLVPSSLEISVIEGVTSFLVCQGVNAGLNRTWTRVIKPLVTKFDRVLGEAM